MKLIPISVIDYNKCDNLLGITINSGGIVQCCTAPGVSIVDTGTRHKQAQYIGMVHVGRGIVQRGPGNRVSTLESTW